MCFMDTGVRYALYREGILSYKGRYFNRGMVMACYDFVVL
jgi:hypothetical protein